MTRRLRTWREPVALYSRQRASASCADTRRLLVVEGFICGTALLGKGETVLTDEACIGPGPHAPLSPIRGGRPSLQSVGPCQDLRHGRPHRLRHLLAEGQ